MNAIGDEGGVALGKALHLQAGAPTATLVDLDVSKNQLGAAACSALLMPVSSDSEGSSTTVPAAGTRNGLSRLNLFGNRIGDQVTITPVLSSV